MSKGLIKVKEHLPKVVVVNMLVLCVVVSMPLRFDVKQGMKVK